MLKSINIKLKFIKDEKLFCHCKPYQAKQDYLSIKQCVKILNLNKIKYLQAIKIKITKFDKKWFS